MINVVKVGGAVVEDSCQLAVFLDGFSQLSGENILVHGGGRSATAMATQLGLPTTMIEGRRVTDADMLRVVEMVYGGLVNKTIVAQCQARGVDAVGLTGADMDIIRAVKRPVKNGVDYGYVGDVAEVNAFTIEELLSHMHTPIIAPLTHDGAGQMLNTNADTIASEIAKALARSRRHVILTFCFEKTGVLLNPDDDNSVIDTITLNYYEELKQKGIVRGGMIPKLDNAFEAIAAGVSQVRITSALNLQGGTVIC